MNRSVPRTSVAGTGATVPGIAVNQRGGTLLGVAWLVAAVMICGSLWMSLAWELKACPLCLYERSFVMAAFAVLSISMLLTGQVSRLATALLTLPLVAAGGALAGVHVYLDRSGVLECPAGFFGIGAAPDQSLAGFVLLSVLLLAAGQVAAGGRVGSPLVAATAFLGGLLGLAAVKSSPPLPPPQPKFDAQGVRLLSGCEPALAADFVRPAQQPDNP